MKSRTDAKWVVSIAGTHYKFLTVEKAWARAIRFVLHMTARERNRRKPIGCMIYFNGGLRWTIECDNHQRVVVYNHKTAGYAAGPKPWVFSIKELDPHEEVTT